MEHRGVIAEPEGIKLEPARTDLKLTGIPTVVLSHPRHS